MITFEPTEDYELVKQILTNDAIYDKIADDYSSKESLQFDRVLWIIVKEGEKVLGMFMLQPHNMICLEVHTCLLPGLKSKTAIEIGQKGIAWVFSSFPIVLKLITNVPEDNYRAMRFALFNGFREEGVNKKSIIQHGRLKDQVMLGITKEEWQCQQSHTSQ